MSRNHGLFWVAISSTLLLARLLSVSGQFVPPGLQDTPFFTQNERCILLTSGLPLATQVQSRQTVQLELGKLSHSARFKKMLHKESSCLASVNFGNTTLEFNRLLGITKIINRHMTFLYSREKPRPDILRQINRPLIWLKSGINKGQPTLKSVLFCPLQGKPRTTDAKALHVCNENRCVFNKHFELSKEPCQNPFDNQIVNIAVDTASPATLRPELMNIQSLSGYNINLWHLLAKHYNFKPNIYFTKIGHFLPGNQTFSPGRYGDVLSGKADVSIAAIILLFQSFFDLTAPLAFAKAKYITRAPMPEKDFANITRPFDPGVWLLIGISNLVLSLVMYQIYIAYNWSRFMRNQNLARKERSPINFLLYPFAKFTEPDPLPWFKKWSTGKIVSFLWSFTSAFLVMAYVSNLRTNLTLINYTKPPNTLQDIVDSGHRVFIYINALRQRKSFLEATGQQHSVKYKIADLAEKTNGFYDPIDHLGVHRDMPKEIIEYGAFGLVEDLALPFMYKSRPRLRQQNIHLLQEEVSSYYTTNIMRKYSPGVDKIRLITARATEMGLIKFWLTQHLPSSGLTQIKAPKVGLQSFGQSHFYASSIFYCTGMVLAFLAFVVEKTPFRFARSPTQLQV